MSLQCEQVQRSIERELGGKLSAFFSYVDPFPLASDTVAQVSPCPVCCCNSRGAMAAKRTRCSSMKVLVMLDLSTPFDEASRTALH